MRESATYQAILAEGRAEGRADGERTLLIRLGTRRFGPPDERMLSRLRGITDADHLAALGERLLDVNGWDALFDEANRT